MSLRTATSTWQKLALVLLGLFLSLVLLEVGLRLGGFVLLAIQDYGNLRSIKQKGAYRILCIGESTTQGQYPHLLEEALNRRHTGVRFSVIDKGIPGTNTSAILFQVESYLAKYRPDMVVAMMGINDEGKRVPFESAPASKWTFFIRSLRVYKLISFLKLHLLTKAKETELCKPSGDKPISVKTENLLPKTGLKETSADSISTAGSFKKAVRIISKDGNAYVKLEVLNREQGELSQAEDFFKKAIEIDPKNAFAYAELGWLYCKQGEFSKAGDSFKKAMELNPKNDQAHVGLGWLYNKQGKFAQAEDSFKKAIEINPKNDNAYVGLGRFYRLRGKSAQAEDFFKKAIEINPENDNAYVGLGWLYRVQGELAEAEDFFKKAIEINPENDNAYVGLGWFYREQGKFAQAEDSFKKAIEINPKRDNVYVELGKLYRVQGKSAQAEDSLEKAIEINPQKDYVYVELGEFYRVQGKSAQAEDSLKKAIEINPENDRAYVGLGWFYRERGELAQAEDFFKKAIEINPENNRVLGAMFSLYNEMGKFGLAQEYSEKANLSKIGDFIPITVNNYRKLRGILDRKGIRLVCVQYPVRNVGSLKRIFKEDKGIIFVDNENVFKEAVKKGSYKEYFWDMFGGDFGHCTPKGNKLLAENIANVILREVFNKR